MSAFSSEQILGISFFIGTAEQAVAEMSENGGLLVAPSGTCFERFLEDEDYRRAIVTADLVLPDSGLMVCLWRLLRRRKINRISGLAYLSELLRHPPSGLQNFFWILPNESSKEKLLGWARGEKLSVTGENCYLAPMYENRVVDEVLLAAIESKKPASIIVGIGAGPQEKLGWFLRENLSYRPAIHCIGGALGFVTGDQVAIPHWADHFYLGWFLRLLSQPRVFIPRLWRARVLPLLIARYGRELPPLKGGRLKG